jgi:hypothetical protein
MPLPRRPRRVLKLVATRPRQDFSDASSRRVLDAATRSVARALGRAAADEYFDRMLSSSRKGQ